MAKLKRNEQNTDSSLLILTLYEKQKSTANASENADALSSAVLTMDILRATGALPESATAEIDEYKARLAGLRDAERKRAVKPMMEKLASLRKEEAELTSQLTKKIKDKTSFIVYDPTRSRAFTIFVICGSLFVVQFFFFLLNQLFNNFMKVYRDFMLSFFTGIPTLIFKCKAKVSFPTILPTRINNEIQLLEEKLDDIKKKAAAQEEIIRQTLEGTEV